MLDKVNYMTPLKNTKAKKKKMEEYVKEAWLFIDSVEAQR